MPGQPLYPVNGPPSPPPPPAPVPVAAPPQDGGDGSISTELIVVLTIVGIILAGVVVVLVSYLWKKWRAERQPPPPEQRQPPPPEQRQPSLPAQRQPPPLEQRQLTAQRQPPSLEQQQLRTQPLPPRGARPALSTSQEVIIAIGDDVQAATGDNEIERDEFWNEVVRLASLHHPNVVAFYGAVIDGPGGSIATVTEYIEDGSLRQALQVNKSLFDRRGRLLVAMDIAICMEYLHEKKIVHFDLKSDNLLVNLRDPRRPVCKVCDLGLSKARIQTLVSGGMRGTLPWMAPELLDGTPVSEKVDVYSFGIVMWELLTGEEPYADLHHGAILGGILGNTLRPDVPKSCEPWWSSLMVQCWSNEPSERPPFSEIANKLRSIASSLSTA